MNGWFKPFHSHPSPLPPVPASLPAGLRIYAIGDIHGRADLLDALLAQIALDAAGYEGRAIVLCLGDYIDRGPNTREVIERLRAPLPAPLEALCLMGNHEQVFLGLFNSINHAAGWLTYGGMETLHSYGIPMPPGTFTQERLLDMQKNLQTMFPPEHRAWLESLPTHATFGDYHFVHSGVRPGVPLDQQTDADRLWIRRGFLDYTGPLEKVIVHGHVIMDDVNLTPYHIGIDTGAYATGRLTALALEGSDRRILQTGLRPPLP